MTGMETRVASTINGVTTKFVGEYYEVTGEVVTKYYGGKTSMWTTTGGFTYLLADHLGSNSLITSDSGTLLSETRYKPWGEIRYSTGTTTTPYTYTGQYSNTADFGWMYYKARWYDNELGRFAQPDSIIPGAGDPRAWDRYSYVKNNPIKYNDPTGHNEDCGLGESAIDGMSCKKRIEIENNIDYLDKERERCAANPGSANCPNYVEIIGFAVTTITIGNVLPEIPAAIDALGWEAANLCSSSPTCWNIIGAAGTGATATCANGSCGNKIGATGDIGEQYLKSMGGDPQQRFHTSQGIRVVDQLINRVANESKVGYVSLTPEIALQVSKDVELMSENTVSSVSWFFFTSPITGKQGPSLPLFQLLYQSGISIQFGP